MMREAFLKDRYRAVEQAVRAEKTILVLGADASLLSQALRDHPLLDIWDSQNHGGATISKSLPRNTGCILVSRFVNHGTLASVSKQAKAIGVPLVQQILQTGELKQVLAPLLATAPESVKTTHRLGWTSIKTVTTAPQETPVAEPPHKIAKKGALRDFVRRYANVRAAVLSAEAARLHPIARAAGLMSTLASIEQGIRAERKAQGIAGPRQTLPGVTLLPVTVAPMPPVVPTVPLFTAPVIPQPVAATAPTRPAAPGLGRNIRDAVRLLDESIAAMTLVRDELAKHQDAIERSANESQILGEMQAIMAKLGR